MGKTFPVEPRQMVERLGRVGRQQCRARGVVFALGDPIVLEALVDESVALTLAETPIAKDQQLAPDGASRKRLRATVPDTMELRGWLLGYGALIEVKKPKALREEMRETVKAMAERYGVG